MSEIHRPVTRVDTSHVIFDSLDPEYDLTNTAAMTEPPRQLSDYTLEEQVFGGVGLSEMGAIDWVGVTAFVLTFAYFVTPGRKQNDKR
jgi:hypothetical protein